MYQLLINYATVIAFVAFSLDLMYQIFRIQRTRGAKAVSLPGLMARTGGTFILLLKFIEVGDGYLIAGQVIFFILVTIYLTLAFRYRNA